MRRCQLVAVLAALASVTLAPAEAAASTKPPLKRPLIILTVNGKPKRVSEAQLQKLVFLLSPRALRTATITIRLNGRTHSGTAASYRLFLIQTRQAVAANHARDMLLAVESYHADNTGVSTDIDRNSKTSGYAGMTLSLLRSHYDHTLSPSIEAVRFASSNSYCLEATVKGQTVRKNGPNASIEVGRCVKRR